MKSISLQSKANAKTAQVITSDQHQLISDISNAEGGEDFGPSPHDLYDAALASCKALTLMWYANKKGIKISNIDTRVERDDSEERQGIYKLHTRLVISGDFSDAEFKQLSAVAEKCPVHKLMTSVTTEITTQVERA
ncbi:OsmC family protein [Undibacterium cyanobacteriorum]|uniref:OsmC family protein n=1 Tax=Undibacterium cyanobacteriorum TaxID=3073561 RepID=A0ABY9RLK6_9BURK|nr:OsmC family protein [Undibacterium sp. 20NA77.5]WMW81579.1 OsmC family protein [Undibacterium sp. 20NA77.5]